MYYVPVTDNYYRIPSSYIPVDDTNSKLNKVQKELAELREELNDLRLEKETCRLCSPPTRTIQCDETCSICYSRPREEYSPSRKPSPVHYCSICHDYVIDQTYPPPPLSPPSHKKKTKKKVEYDDKLSEYLSRQIDLQRLQPRYIPEERPVWIPTAYKHDYPHRRWATRESKFSEP